jgi:diguanylate cyclase (GGDEF)-like protein
MRTDWNPAATTGPHARVGYRTLCAIDPVTGLGNAERWSQRAALTQCDAYWRQEPVALLAVDIDQFARINNEYSYSAGDDLLRSVGNVLRSATRSSDLICRWDADEFLILAPGRDAEAALELGIRIRDRVRLLVTEAMASVDWFVTISDMTVSVGIAVGTDLASTALLTRARGALAHVKSCGHDLIYVAGEAFHSGGPQ